jgi:endonuclease YncB( thermonuclease family)
MWTLTIDRLPCTAERVIDGDSFIMGSSIVRLDIQMFHVKATTLEIGGYKIRIKDYRAPERNEIGGSAATTFARELFTAYVGDTWIVPYEDRMSFERYVSDVWMGDQLFRELMVEAGHGTYVPYYLRDGRWHYADARGVIVAA